MATAKKPAAKKTAATKKPAAAAAPVLAMPTEVAGLALDAFAQRILSPSYDLARVTQVDDALEGAADVADAWEALAARSLIPMEWITEPARMVLVAGRQCPCVESIDAVPAKLAEYGLRGINRSPEQKARAVEWGWFAADFGHNAACPVAWLPPTIEAARTLALDPDGVAAAELLVREFLRRVWPDREERRVVWRLQDPARTDAVNSRKLPTWLNVGSPRKTDLAEIELHRALRARRFPVPESQWYPIAIQVGHDAARRWRWEARTNDPRPDPYVPLCDLWALGYMFDAAYEEHVVLRAVMHSTERPR